MYNIIADLHTHTVASTHAYSTIDENALEASKKGLFAIAVTDHAKTMPGAPLDGYFRNLRILPKYIHGVRVLRGIEANITDYEGNLDAPEYLLKMLEIRIASMHIPTLNEEPSIYKCTDAYMKAAYNKNIDIIGHPGQEYFKFDYEKVIKECSHTGTVI